jgi:AP2 domain
MKLRVRRHEVTQPLDKPYRFIPLTQGKNAIVDVADYDWLNGWNWCAVRIRRTFYASGVVNGKQTRMHWLVLGKGADHKNRDGLDNRRENLRKASSTQNRWNMPARITNKSGYKGVYLHAEGKWMAALSVNGKRIHRYGFATKEDAARVYDRMAKKYHGRFAFQNLPHG